AGPGKAPQLEKQPPKPQKVGNSFRLARSRSWSTGDFPTAWKGTLRVLRGSIGERHKSQSVPFKDPRPAGRSLSRGRRILEPRAGRSLGARPERVRAEGDRTR